MGPTSARDGVRAAVVPGTTDEAFRAVAQVADLPRGAARHGQVSGGSALLAAGLISCIPPATHMKQVCTT